MNVALRQSMTVEEFLAWEARQPLRWEFNGVQPVGMTGGSAAHAVIERNLIVALTLRLQGKPCRPYGSNLKILAAGSIRYPDAFVVCTPVPSRSYVVADPVVVFEILSPTTAHEDLVVKCAEYRATPSIRRYVVLEQTHAGALVFTRKGEDWVSDPVSGEGAVLDMPEIGIEVSLAELYTEVELFGPSELAPENGNPA